MTNKKKYHKPSFIEDLDKWSTNRRKFIKTIGVFAVYSQILKLQSCKNSQTKNYQANKYLTALQVEIIQNIQEILFPDDGNRPSVTDINAYGHFVWVLSDKRKRQD